MEFQGASDRLNYFFSPHRWALLVDATDQSAISSHLQTLRTACTHWGSKLEFPLQLNPQAFDNSQEALAFWLQKLPNLRLLHYRKQDILLSELYQGYDPQRANQLLRRKLNLSPDSWGHLLYFAASLESSLMEILPYSSSFKMRKSSLEKPYFHMTFPLS